MFSSKCPETGPDLLAVEVGGVSPHTRMAEPMGASMSLEEQVTEYISCVDKPNYFFLCSLETIVTIEHSS